MPALLAHADGKNFYVSCERVFQPKLRGVPVAVLSNNDGCAIARSDEAKALGIKMGDPWHLNRDQWNKWGVQLRSSNYTLYGDMSARMMKVFSSFTPELEVYSIDEAFLGFDGIADPLGEARRIRAAVWDQVYLPIGIGIGTTKTLAKAANKAAKYAPGGVVYLPDEASQTAALAKMDLGDVWGIGSRLVPKLGAIGISTPLQLRDADPRMIRERFNVVLQRTVMELQGTPCLELEEERPDSKTICSSRSFGRVVESWHEMAEAATSYMQRAGEKLRRQNLAASSIVVMVTTNYHKPNEAQYYATKHVRLTIATADSARLIRATLYALHQIYRPGFKYKKCGVLLLDLVPAVEVQSSLFIRPDDPRRQRLMAAVDQLNKRYGRDRVRYAVTGSDRPWRLRSEFHSPRYTTRWDELLSV